MSDQEILYLVKNFNLGTLNDDCLFPKRDRKMSVLKIELCLWGTLVLNLPQCSVHYVSAQDYPSRPRLGNLTHFKSEKAGFRYISIFSYKIISLNNIRIYMMRNPLP